MDQVYNMNGSQKAAALMVALGSETASTIIKHLDEDTVEVLAVEMAKINSLTPENKEELVGGFLLDLKKNRFNVSGGQDFARDLITKSLGKEKAQEILDKLSGINLEEAFAFLSHVEPEDLFTLIKDEHPQMISAVMGYISPKKSAYILKSLPIKVSTDIARRIAKIEKSSPEILLKLAEGLKEKYKKLQKNLYGIKGTTGGVDTLISIMNHLSGKEERKLMDKLDILNPKISQNVRDKIFVFENIINLTNGEIRVLIDEVNNDSYFALALKGASDEIRVKLFRNMSQNRATDIINEMENLGQVRLSDVEDARANIVIVLRQLHDNGIIILKKNGDILVE